MPPVVVDADEAILHFLYRAPIGLVESTLDGEIEIVNPMSVRLLMPLSADGNLDNLFRILDHVAPQLRSLVADFADTTGSVCEGLRIPLPAVVGGNPAPQVLSLSLLKLNETRLMTMVTDATLEVQREQTGLDRQLSDAVRTDVLTHMPNRAAMLERIQSVLDHKERARSGEFAVLFINCDRFRQVNDTHGNTTGDEVLTMMAERLRSTLRMRDRNGRPADGESMAARVGGDEFVVMLSNLVLADDVYAVAQRLLDVLSTPYGVGALQPTFSFSMGILLAAQSSGDAESALLKACIAMTEAKRSGGAGYAVFEYAMQERAAVRGGIESGLRRAVSKQELFLVYQPVVGLHASGAIDYFAGVEALVRWNHPNEGTMSPADFISVAEDCGMIGAIGDFVLSTACDDFVWWQRELGPRAPRSVAVNLSRAQLRQPDYVASVDRVLRITGVAPQCLHLEITESLAAQDESVQQQLRGLKSLGVQLALDDFGTGYSSLASLHQLPVDTVKIDRSFVSQSDTSHHHRVLIEATVKVAHSLGMRTVAEGVETEAQAEVIRTLGCDKGQGYLYSRPLTGRDLIRWLREAKPLAA